MGANIAAFSHGQGSFNFSKRKKTRAGMYNSFLNNLNRFIIVSYYKYLVFINKTKTMKFIIVIKCLRDRKN